MSCVHHNFENIRVLSPPNIHLGCTPEGRVSCPCTVRQRICTLWCYRLFDNQALTFPTDAIHIFTKHTSVTADGFRLRPVMTIMVVEYSCSSHACCVVQGPLRCASYIRQLLLNLLAHIVLALEALFFECAIGRLSGSR